MQKDKSVDLIREVLTTADAIGYEKTLEANIAARQNSPGLKSVAARVKRKEKIVQTEICNIFDLTIDQVKKKHLRHDKKPAAQMLIAAYFTLELKYIYEESGRVMDVHSSYISHMMRDFNLLSHAIPEEKELLERYQRIKEVLDKKLDI